MELLPLPCLLRRKGVKEVSYAYAADHASGKIKADTQKERLLSLVGCNVMSLLFAFSLPFSDCI